MKKTLIALAALATLAAGTATTTTAAQAKVHVNLNVGVPGLYVGSGYGYYEPTYYDYSPDCGYVTVKKVYWIDGHKVIKWKKKLVCE